MSTQRSRNRALRGAVLLALVPLAYVLTPIDAAHSGGSSEAISRAKPPDPIVTELEPVVRAWREAVTSRDSNAVLEFALPEFREVISRDLGDEGSRLNKDLYYGEESLAKFFRRAPSAALFPHRDLVSLGRGTTVCYFDEVTFKEASESTLDGLPKSKDRSLVRCFFMFFDDERWYVSFAFSYKDG